MPLSSYRPDLMGTATLSPSGSFEAGSMQSFALVYTAGAFGLDDTGSLKIGFRFATDFGPVQFTDSQAPGYTTAEASNGASLELRWEFKRNIRPWSRSLYIGVVEGFLAPGDTITIRFGDRRHGSPGIRIQTWCEEAFEFRVFADPIATYDYVALPESPTIAIVPGPARQWHAVLPTAVRAGVPFRLGIRAADAWGNPTGLAGSSLRVASSELVGNLPDRLEIGHDSRALTIENLVVDRPGEIVVDLLGLEDALLCRSNPLRVLPETAALVHFWGDTHGQSNETLGTNSARDYFAFGRDLSFLDVIGHQGNDFQITSSFWRELNELTAAFDEDGRFVCIPGYEWSANTAVGGDRNVHFRREGETIHRSSHAQIAEGTEIADEASDAHDARELFRRLEGRDCVVVAHVGGRYADIAFAHHPLETAIEIHSDWGTFEWLLNDAFALGYRVGIVANSDGHKGRPGASYPGASFFGSQGGLTCFLADRLDRDAIFRAMRGRRHYATTGNRPFIALSVTTDEDAVVFDSDPAFDDRGSAVTRELGMGDIARVGGGRARLSLDIVATAPIERVDIFDGPDIIETVRPYGTQDLGTRIRLVYSGANNRGRGRAVAWKGEVLVSGNLIRHASIVNHWNLDTGIGDRAPDGLRWTAVTTGNFGAIDIWLAESDAGTVWFTTPFLSGTIKIEEIGIEPTLFECGGLDRHVSVQRLPERMSAASIRLARTLDLQPDTERRLFVRVQQEDGHRAWTSPVYLRSAPPA